MTTSRDHRQIPHAPLGGLIVKLLLKGAVHLATQKIAEHRAKREAEAARKRNEDGPPPSGSPALA